MNLKDTVDKLISKKKLLIVFVVGVLIMFVPNFNNHNKDNIKNVELSEKINEEKLEKILKKIHGIDEADVFITYRDSGTINYAYDVSNNNNQQELEIKINDKSPVISRTINPKIEGVLVVVKGERFDEFDLCNAVKAATGAPLHRIYIKNSKGDWIWRFLLTKSL